jgi:TRAP-type C4-dicarboxylate transport system permease small subunit
MKAFFYRINQFLSGFTGWLMLAMMILLVTDIVFRTYFRPVQDLAELSVFVMMAVIYLGMARCEEHKEHVNLEIVANALPRLPRRIMSLFSHILAVGTVGLLLYAVAVNAIAAYRSNVSAQGAFEFPLWPVMLTMVVGLVFFFFQTIVNIVDEVRKPGEDRGKPSAE